MLNLLCNHDDIDGTYEAPDFIHAVETGTNRGPIPPHSFMPLLLNYNVEAVTCNSFISLFYKGKIGLTIQPIRRSSDSMCDVLGIISWYILKGLSCDLSR